MSQSPWRCVRCLRQAPYVTRHCNSPWCQRCKAVLDAKGTRVCRDCRTELPLASFRDGAAMTGRCPACRRARVRGIQRRYYARHRERLNAERKAWYRANREHAIAGNQARYRRKKWKIWKGEAKA